MINSLPLVLERCKCPGYSADGKWKFLGRVPSELAFICADGSTPTDEVVSDILRCSSRSMGMKHHGVVNRYFLTKEEAVAAAGAIGAVVKQICE